MFRLQVRDNPDISMPSEPLPTAPPPTSIPDLIRLILPQITRWIPLRLTRKTGRRLNTGKLQIYIS
ncbi:hypothetical protein MSKU9_0827 [Komagataeibacter diospyri]|uniref:Uncharacterized protein n=1 Tax=Komagataeibacter diospyri TaxID=1932662 RepID=A0A4P5NXN8_9PROT|nr:hypothetical protein MSKU9_0827 [Komagataeibacter diospyri]